MNFKSLTQLLDHFKDEKVCIEYYEQIRWNGAPVCPFCECDKKPYKTNRGYKCSNNECYKKFTVKVGTIFENSKIPFRIWFASIFLATTSKKGISSVQLSVQLGITQKTAWFVLHRIREMLTKQAPEMLGENKTVEIDETYIGGKDGNKHTSKRRSELDPELTNDGSKYNKKKVVVGLIERNSKVVLKHVPQATKENMVDFIKGVVPNGSTIYTDEYKAYKELQHTYTHKTIIHSLRIYVQGDVHTNTIENFWSVLKRGLYGIYHQVSDKHLERYLNEFASRYNARELGNQEKFELFLKDSESRLSYKTLIG